MPPPNREEPAIVVTKTYDLVLWLLPKAETFSRAYRFSLGERLVAHALDLLLALVEAAYTANKAALLQQANAKVNGLRYLLRMAKDLRLVSVDSYAFASERLVRAAFTARPMASPSWAGARKRGTISQKNARPRGGICARRDFSPVC